MTFGCAQRLILGFIPVTLHVYQVVGRIQEAISGAEEARTAHGEAAREKQLLSAEVAALRSRLATQQAALEAASGVSERLCTSEHRLASCQAELASLREQVRAKKLLWEGSRVSVPPHSAPTNQNHNPKPSHTPVSKC